MKSLLIIFLISLTAQISTAVTKSSESTDIHSLEGQVWEYVAFYYQNQRYEKPNPALHVRFDFKSASLMSLYWYRDDDPAYCHRMAEYRWDKPMLEQKIMWLDPKNSAECSKDPDMQMGRQSRNKLEMVGHELFLYLELNGEDFIYILNKINL